MGKFLTEKMTSREDRIFVSFTSKDRFETGSAISRLFDQSPVLSMCQESVKDQSKDCLYFIK